MILFKFFWNKVFVHRKLKLLNFLVDFVFSWELTTETPQIGPGIFIAQVFVLAREVLCLKGTIIIMEHGSYRSWKSWKVLEICQTE